MWVCAACVRVCTVYVRFFVSVMQQEAHEWLVLTVSLQGFTMCSAGAGELLFALCNCSDSHLEFINVQIKIPRQNSYFLPLSSRC